MNSTLLKKKCIITEITYSSGTDSKRIFLRDIDYQSLEAMQTVQFEYFITVTKHDDVPEYKVGDIVCIEIDEREFCSPPEKDVEAKYVVPTEKELNSNPFEDLM